MGNGTSRVVGCFVPFSGKGGGVDIDFLDPLDEGLGHSFCYVRPMFLDSPPMTPSTSERFTIDSSTLDSGTLSGSFRHDTVEDPSGLHRPNKSLPETTFKAISGASVSANVSTARTGNQSALFASDAQEPAASFESTSSFAAIPLQPVPRGVGPINGFMSGPLERGYGSGPLERAGGFMSGPIEKGAMSGPLDAADKSNFSAPLAHGRRRPRLHRLMRSVSGPMRSTLSRTFSRHPIGTSWMQRFFLHPITQFAWHPKEPRFQSEALRHCLEEGPLEGEYRKIRNLQWAHGKAGEDRVHVVLSEEQGWLFIGIYDGFSGPDAPDFLMSNLYRAIDKELEGLLWDYEEKSVNGLPESLQDTNAMADSNCREVDCINSCSSALDKGNMEESCKEEIVMGQFSKSNIVMGREELHGIAKLQVHCCEGPSCSGRDSPSLSTEKLVGQGRKSKRLYELLQMEPCDEQVSPFGPNLGKKKSFSCDFQELSQDEMSRPCLLNLKGGKSSCHGEYLSTTGDGIGSRVESNSQTVTAPLSSSGERQSRRKSMVGLKFKQMYLKKKSLRKKLFPWSYDWHREETCLNGKISEPSRSRRCKSGYINHDDVLGAMARALETSEEAYMEMVEKALDKSPELALMGSCVLVMLMKDQDVYVMNLGDSRAILAQERPHDRHSNSALLKDDARLHNRSRESLVRMELDRISEESPIHSQYSQVNKVNKSRDISMCRLKMRAVQLSTDHSMSVEEVCKYLFGHKDKEGVLFPGRRYGGLRLLLGELILLGNGFCMLELLQEVLRIKAEHVDDGQAIINDRVKGQLKVTRAFGAGFLKKDLMQIQIEHDDGNTDDEVEMGLIARFDGTLVCSGPRCNEAILEMFQIDYVGTAPYISCIPSVLHHRLSSNDRFLVLSSDGLYQYFSNEEVVAHITWFMENVPEGDPAQYLIAELLFRAAKKNGMDFHELLDIPQGDRRKYHDDVSIMVVSLEGRIWRSSG
ncbi:hypothetical protein RJ640_025729 [Escallonia rubra]|uniref:PPM-type phosphatase domain-containing protein n=1 Tax=Escallonia rubra TaxID=112253 RepID=A0AA88UPY1_9ASTE|nr:hypothetical protein RJ640_025729 [Escallonia rubra]